MNLTIAQLNNVELMDILMPQQCVKQQVNVSLTITALKLLKPSFMLFSPWLRSEQRNKINELYKL